MNDNISILEQAVCIAFTVLNIAAYIGIGVWVYSFIKRGATKTNQKHIKD